jgi:hypothetical protein
MEDKEYEYLDIDSYSDKDAYDNSYVILKCGIAISILEFNYIRSEFLNGNNIVNFSYGAFVKNEDGSISLLYDYKFELQTEKDFNEKSWVEKYIGRYFN